MITLSILANQQCTILPLQTKVQLLKLVVLKKFHFYIYIQPIILLTYIYAQSVQT